MARILEPGDHPYYDWRDPDMKVLGYKYVDDKSVVYEATAEERNYNANLRMQFKAPLWRDDPSYFWRKKK
jgi:hypothetical protein